MSSLKHFLILLCIVLIMFFKELHAQEETSIVTDRPDITESAIVVPFNAFQIETGFKYQKQKFVENEIQFEYDNLILASTLFRYGINDIIELRFGGEYLNSKATTEVTEINVEGLQGLFVGSKLQLLKNQNIVGDLALLFEIGLPFGNKNLRPDKAEPKFIFAAARDINEQLSIGVNIGSQYESKTSKSNILYSASIGIELGDRFGTFVEYFGDAVKGFLPRHNFDMGFTYLQKKNIQIDASVGTILFSKETDWFGSIGFSVRLGHND